MNENNKCTIQSLNTSYLSIFFSMYTIYCVNKFNFYIKCKSNFNISFFNKNFTINTIFKSYVLNKSIL